MAGQFLSIFFPIRGALGHGEQAKPGIIRVTPPGDIYLCIFALAEALILRTAGLTAFPLIFVHLARSAAAISSLAARPLFRAAFFFGFNFGSRAAFVAGWIGASAGSGIEMPFRPAAGAAAASSIPNTSAISVSLIAAAPSAPAD